MALPAGQQLSLRLLRHRAHSTNRHHGRGPRQNTADSRYRSGAGLIAKGRHAGRFMWQDSDSNWLQLKLAHLADCSEATSANRPRSRNLRLYEGAIALSKMRYRFTTLPPIPSIARFIGSLVSRIQPMSPPSIAPGLPAVSRCLR